MAFTWLPVAIATASFAAISLCRDIAEACAASISTIAAAFAAFALMLSLCARAKLCSATLAEDVAAALSLLIFSMFATMPRSCSFLAAINEPMSLLVNTPATTIAAVAMPFSEEMILSPLTLSILSAKENIPLDNVAVDSVALFARSIQLRNEFSIVFQPRLTVLGSLSYSSFTFARPVFSAGITMSVVSLPSPAILRNSPVVLPSPSAIACIIRGACSLTELNS